MRIFLAVFPPPEAQSLVFEAVRSMREVAGAAGSGISWVKRENLHYTLRFLGELGEDGARRAGEAAEEAAEALPAFDVTLGAPGAFPNAHRARVLWIGLAAGEPPFVDLSRLLARALERRGFEREGREFTPHLTIGRVREARHDWTPALAAAPPLAAQEAARFRVGALHVVKSTLSTGGSIYETLVEAALRER